MIWGPRPSGPKPHKALGPRSPSWERGEGGEGRGRWEDGTVSTSRNLTGPRPTSGGDGMVPLWRPSSLQEGNRGSSPLLPMSWWLCRTGPVKSIGERGRAHTEIARNRSNCKIEQKKKGREGKTHGLPPPEAIPPPSWARGAWHRDKSSSSGGGWRDGRTPRALDPGSYTKKCKYISICMFNF